MVTPKMKQQYQKPVIFIKNSTKQVLADNLALCAEQTTNLIIERDALRTANKELVHDNQHLTMQLAAMTEKFEAGKRTIKRYARLYNDAIECNSFKSIKYKVDAKEVKKTFLQRIFDYFQI